jgi:iron(III) transport system substrate-binding protein
MNTIIRKLLGFTLLFWLVAAQAFTGAGKAHASWEAEWERTVEAAKKEGQVTIYTNSSQTTLLVNSRTFQKRFPEIKVVLAYGNIYPRILSERRAGKYLADIAFTGGRTLWELHLARVLDPVSDAIVLPEAADESKWFRGKHEYVDQERKYVFISTANPNAGYFYYNTKLINSKEFNSLWDFLRPEVKGKMAVRDVRTPGPGGDAIRFFYHVPELGTKFIRSFFGEIGLTLFRDQRQGVDWLATGKYPICAFCNSTMIQAAKLQGLPVEVFGLMKEGAWLSAGGGGISLLNRAPHPNAAKVFINWLLLREGQLALQSVGGGATNSRRMDIPKDMIPPRLRLEEGVNYLEVDTWELISDEPILKEINSALAEAEKRRGKR